MNQHLAYADDLSLIEKRPSSFSTAFEEENIYVPHCGSWLNYLFSHQYTQQIDE
jgi:hypothetical protein